MLLLLSDRQLFDAAAVAATLTPIAPPSRAAVAHSKRKPARFMGFMEFEPYELAQLL